MSAGITDKFTEASNGSRPIPTTLSSLRSIGDTSISVGALTGWPTATAVHFIIYSLDANNKKVAGSQTDWKGIASGTTISSLTLIAGTDAGDSAGAIVEAAPTAGWADDLIAGLLAQHTQAGAHHGLTTDTIATTGNATVGGTLGVTGITTLTAALAANGGMTVLDHLTATGLITFADLASAIFGGQVQTQANAGTAGGNMSWINLGGLKIMWGRTGHLAGGVSAGYTVTLPTFFSAITGAFCSVGGFGSDYGAKAGFDTAQPGLTSANIVIISAGGDTADCWWGLIGS